MMGRLVVLFLISSVWQQYSISVQGKEQTLQLSPNVEYLIPVEIPMTTYSTERSKNTHTFKVFITEEGSCNVFLDTFERKPGEFDLDAEKKLKQLRKHAVRIARDFCKGYTVVFKNIQKSDEQLSFSSDLDTNEIQQSKRKRSLIRNRRGASTTFKALPRGRYRGQTQSQYLNFGDQVTPGKAEAESSQDGSRASVSGTNGMGQAQSQSGFSNGCDGCYDNPDGTQSQTILSGGLNNLNGRYPAATAGSDFRTPQNIGNIGGSENYGQTGGYGQNRPLYKDPNLSPTGNVQTSAGKYPGRQDPSTKTPSGFDEQTGLDNQNRGFYQPNQDYPGEYNKNVKPSMTWTGSPRVQLSPSQINSDDMNLQPHGSWDQSRQTGRPNDYYNAPSPTGSPSGYPSRENNYPPGINTGMRDTIPKQTDLYNKNTDPRGYQETHQQGSPPSSWNQRPTSDSTAKYPNEGRGQTVGSTKLPPSGSGRYPNQYIDTTGKKFEDRDEHERQPPSNQHAQLEQTGKYPSGSGQRPTGYPEDSPLFYPDSHSKTNPAGSPPGTPGTFPTYPESPQDHHRPSNYPDESATYSKRPPLDGGGYLHYPGARNGQDFSQSQTPYPDRDAYPKGYNVYVDGPTGSKNYGPESGQNSRQPTQYPENQGTFSKGYGQYPSVDQGGQRPSDSTTHPGGQSHVAQPDHRYTGDTYSKNNGFYPDTFTGNHGTQNIGKRPTSQTGTSFDKYGNQRDHSIGSDYNQQRPGGYHPTSNNFSGQNKEHGDTSEYPHGQHPSNSNNYPNRHEQGPPRGQLEASPVDYAGNKYYETQPPGGLGEINQPNQNRHSNQRPGNQNGYTNSEQSERGPYNNQFAQKQPSQYDRPDPSTYRLDGSYTRPVQPDYQEEGRSPTRPSGSDVYTNAPRQPGRQIPGDSNQNSDGRFPPSHLGGEPNADKSSGYPDTYPINTNRRPDSSNSYPERTNFGQDITSPDYPGAYRGPPGGGRYQPEAGSYTQETRPGAADSQKGSYYPENSGTSNGYPPAYDSNNRGPSQSTYTESGRPGYGSSGTQGGGRGYDISHNYNSDNIDDTNSQAETSIQQLHNETKASAVSSGKQGGGTAQSQIIGSYTGSGSFSAQAQTIDANRGAQTQISVGGKGATSTAQGNAGYGQSQAQLQLGSETGATIAGAQSGGWNHGTNTQVEASDKGGMADAQANGPGSTSSQAQIGFQPYKEGSDRNEDSKPGSPFYGGGTASAQSGNYAGQSQTQIQGKFKYGISYNGAAQAGSGGRESSFKNKTVIKPLDIFNNKPVLAEVNASPQAKYSSMNSGMVLNEGMLESESKNVERTHMESHDMKEFSSGVASLTPTKKIRHSNAQIDQIYSEDKDTQVMDEYDSEDPDEDEDYDGDFYPSTEASQQKSQSKNTPRDVVVQQTGHGQRQHIILGSLENNGAKVVQDSAQKGLLKEGMLFQPGEVIPGTQGYTIPIGFRGRVSSVSDGDETYAYTDENGESQAQTITLTPGAGNITYNTSPAKTQPTVRSWSPNYGYGRGASTQRRYMNRYNLKSNNNQNIPEQYVTVTKTVAGELDPDKSNFQNKKYAHTYYTKSSTCGYFTFSCNLVYGSNGRTKICKPKAPLNPDGTPVQC